VPVQYSYTSTTLRAVQPVQTLSACTVQLYLYSPMARTGSRDPQCLYSTAKSLLLYGYVQLLETLSACTLSYTSTKIRAVRSVETLSACTVQLYLYHA